MSVLSHKKLTHLSNLLPYPLANNVKHVAKWHLALFTFPSSISMTSWVGSKVVSASLHITDKSGVVMSEKGHLVHLQKEEQLCRGLFVCHSTMQQNMKLPTVTLKIENIPKP